MSNSGQRRLWTVLLFAVIAATSWGYYIESFDVEINMFNDGSYSVTEMITVNFGTEQRHGIYRNIPYKYKKDFKTTKVLISDIKITDEKGEKYERKVERDGYYLKMRVGSPDFTITGRHIYVIKYHVERGMLYFDNYDELYWNVTGVDWNCYINSASAVVYLPKGMRGEDIVKAHCFSGAYGAKESNCSFYTSASTIEFRTTEPLGVYEGLTIGIAFPKGVITGPSLEKRLWWLFLKIWPLLLLPLGLFWTIYQYLTRGRDPINLSIAPRYDPPEKFTPAEAGTLVDERVDMRDMTSTIVDLAVRGYIKIVELDKKKLLFLSNKDYALVKLRDADNYLKNHERLMLTGLFRKGSIVADDKVMVGAKCPDCLNKEIITISSLKENFYTELPSIKNAIYVQLVNNKYFPSNPENVRNKYMGTGITYIAVSLIAGIIIQNILLIVVGIFLGAITMIISRFMPRKTREGVMKAVHIAGFEEFVRRVEKDRIERMIQDDPGIFERLLPFAMALGCADQWASKFEGIFKESPKWFVGEPGVSFAPYYFANRLGNAINTAGSAMNSRPRSSGAGGGSSSFSGGGGFSGGGFGGGGGGAW